MKYLIIGGVAGGATAAARLRRVDEKSEIILIEKGSHISFANCGLPYYLGGVIAERDNLFVQNPRSFSKRFNIDVRVEEEVISVDTTNKKVSIKRLDGTSYQESYDKLLLALGATPIIPPMEGTDLAEVFTLRSMADTDRLQEFIATKKPTRAVIVGGGFIGLEMVENLSNIGINITLIEKENQVLSMMDAEMVTPIHAKLKKMGVELKFSSSVKRITKEGESLFVETETGEKIPTDFLMLSIGVKPNTSLAKKMGLSLGGKEAISVNNYLQTSAKDVYAVGDAIEYPHPITGKPWNSTLAGPANRQARIAADNIAFGNKLTYEGSIGTAIAKVFDNVVAFTGLSEKHLKQEKIPYLSSITHSASHASYYPGSSMITTKLLFAPSDGKLLGAEIVGKEGVDKRIDILATILKLGGTVRDLTLIEQAYAPPFSSAKDPVAMAGYVASNILDGTMPIISVEDLQYSSPEEELVIDVRSQDEHSHGAIEGAINIPLEELREKVSELPKDKPIVVHCAIGLRGYLALRILKGNGFENVRNLSGGYRSYKAFPHKKK